MTGDRCNLHVREGLEPPGLLEQQGHLAGGLAGAGGLQVQVLQHLEGRWQVTLHR